MRLSLPFALPDRRRTVSFVLALVVEALLILVLLLFGPHFIPAPKPEGRATSFSMSPSSEKEAATAPEHRTKAHAAAKPASGTTTPVPPLPPVITPSKVPTPPNALPGVLPIQLGASDISKLKSSASSDDGAETGTDSKLAYGPGEGPGGQPLYNAEWYREPSDAQLNGYLPKGAPPNSWALIACQTMPAFHVDNCRSLGESPVGSGLGRAMREAAWQFLVRPPRRGGKVLVGAWVRIRIDFTLRPSESARTKPESDGPNLPDNDK
jgi:protein TonB